MLTRILFNYVRSSASALNTRCVLTPVGPGGVCHVHADGRDHITAGRFTVCLWTPGKVKHFQLLDGKLLN